MIFIFIFVSFFTVGIVATKDEKPKKPTSNDIAETRIIKQTRQTVYDTELVQDWE